jgi:hypothetical protein
MMLDGKMFYFTSDVTSRQRLEVMQKRNKNTNAVAQAV